MTAVRCEGGPWQSKEIDNFSAMPAQRIPVYAPAYTGMQCDDEQVITLLGHYELEHWPFTAYWWKGIR